MINLSFACDKPRACMKFFTSNTAVNVVLTWRLTTTAHTITTWHFIVNWQPKAGWKHIHTHTHTHIFGTTSIALASDG